MALTAEDREWVRSIVQSAVQESADKIKAWVQSVLKESVNHTKDWVELFVRETIHSATIEYYKILNERFSQHQSDCPNIKNCKYLLFGIIVGLSLIAGAGISEVLRWLF